MSPFQSNVRKTNSKIAENSEICESYSIVFNIIHWCPYSRALRAYSSPVGQRTGGGAGEGSVKEKDLPRVSWGKLGSKYSQVKICVKYIVKLNFV